MLIRKLKHGVPRAQSRGNRRGWGNADGASSRRQAVEEGERWHTPGPVPQGRSLPTAPSPLERGQGQKWEMTAGGEGTKVQLTTGDKAVSSNRRPGSPADLRLNVEQCSSSMIPTARIARGSPCVPSHPVDICLAVQQFQALAVSPHIGACLHSFPRLTDERLFSLSLFF